MGSDAVAIKADMSNPAEVDALFKETAAAFSDPVSILVRIHTYTYDVKQGSSMLIL